ncbi:protein kinase [Nonomuraea ferruginea]
MVPGYRDVRQLDSGRTGRVFLATYQETGAYVAIKYLNATLRRDDDFMTRYRQDAAELVEIDHPHVVRVYEYVETPRRAAVVMELADGVSLREILRENVRVSPEAALVVVKSTLEALAAAHGRGVAHRDVRPENLLVQADGTAKLSGFGIVTHAEEPGVPAGSPPYMAPELWTRGEAGPLADLYAAACVLFEAVRGRAPYRGEDLAALRDKHLVEPPPLEVVPDALRGLLRHGLAKAPRSPVRVRRGVPGRAGARRGRRLRDGVGAAGPPPSGRAGDRARAALPAGQDRARARPPGPPSRVRCPRCRPICGWRWRPWWRWRSRCWRPAGRYPRGRATALMPPGDHRGRPPPATEPPPDPSGTTSPGPPSADPSGTASPGPSASGPDRSASDQRPTGPPPSDSPGWPRPDPTTRPSVAPPRRPEPPPPRRPAGAPP